MKLGLVGMGRMGANMARRLHKGGHEVVVFDREPDKTKTMVKEGLIGADSIEDMVKKLDSPRIIWVMLPAGKVTEEKKLIIKSEAGKTVIEQDLDTLKQTWQKTFDW